MILAYLLLLTGLTISSVAIYYSVVGLTAIFSAAAVPIMIMGVSLEVAKLVCAAWIKQYWTQVPRLMKTYMVTAVVVLMLITSMGIFGFLSKAHNDQNLVSGDVGAKLAIYDEKIKTARDNIEADRKQLQQMDAAVDQVMSRSSDEKGADKANAIRKSQRKDRAALAKDIETNQRIVSQLNDEAAPIRAENRKVEAEVGPIKYIAAFLYGVAPDSTMLEKAVTWIIIMIVVVFDPLAVIMLLAAQMTFEWIRRSYTTEEQGQELLNSPKQFKMEMPEVPDFLKRFKDRINDRFKKKDLVADITAENVHNEIEFPFAGKGIQPSMPLTASYVQPNVEAEPEVAYEPDNGALTEDRIQQINDLLAENTVVAEPVVEVVDEEPNREELLAEFIEQQQREVERLQQERDLLFQAHSHEMTRADELAVQLANLQAEPVVEEPVLITRIAFPESNVEVPVEAPTQEPVAATAAPYKAPGAEPQPETAAKPKGTPAAEPARVPRTEFGNAFPNHPEKGDMFLRTDFKPNRLFKWNDTKWIEVNKNITDAYSYNDAYIQYLTEKLFSGEYSYDDLSELEQQQVQQVIGGRRG